MRCSEKYPFSLKIIKYDEDSFEYEVLFDDFPEVVGFGDSASEAIEEAYFNLDAYLEYCKEKNLAIPEPSNKLSLNDFSGKLTVRIPKTLHRDLSDYASSDGMSLNTIAIEAFRFYLNKESLMHIEEESKNSIQIVAETTKAQTESWFYKYSNATMPNEKNYNSFFGNIGGCAYAN